MAMFNPVPEPKSALAVPRVLAPTAGLRVSPLCLGAMSVGDAWNFLGGKHTKEGSLALLDAFYEQGGNFIDTSVNYQDGRSEQIIGEWMEARGVRDQMVIATKFTTNYMHKELAKTLHSANYGGNGRKNLHLSVKESLKNLKTDYIDILYLHWWDYTTSIEEVMDSLDAVVKSGKVLYLGISDTPAWIVSAANTYAKAHGKTPFSVYQGRWNLILRDFERDILPMARTFGMALAPWDVLGGGRFKTKKQLEDKKKDGEGIRQLFGGPELTETEAKVSTALEKVAGELGVGSIQAVALAYVISKAQYVFPIVGGRKPEYLKDNIKALTIKLSDEQIAELEGATTFDLGFPTNMLGTDPHLPNATPGFFGQEGCGLVWQKDGKPIGHA